jgi:hypothetical protein
MESKQRIEFPAITEDGTLLDCVTMKMVDCNKTRPKGVKQVKTWDPIKIKFVMVTGFYIEFEGVEYGSIDMTEEEYLAKCREACLQSTEYRIHVTEFTKEFV